MENNERFDMMTGRSEAKFIADLAEELKKAPKDDRKVVFLATAQWYSAPGGRVDVYIAVCEELGLTVSGYSLEEVFMAAHWAAMEKLDMDEDEDGWPHVVLDFARDRIHSNGVAINIRMNAITEQAKKRADKIFAAQQAARKKMDGHND